MKIWFCIGLTALCFGGWPLMARMAGKTGTTGAFIMAALALLPMAAVLLRQGVELPASSSTRWLLIAGVLMGTGFIAYNFVITSPLLEVSITVPIASALVVIVSTAGGICFFSEPLTSRKVIGIVVLIFGIILLRPAVEKPPSADQPSTGIRADTE